MQGQLQHNVKKFIVIFYTNFEILNNPQSLRENVYYLRGNEHLLCQENKGTVDDVLNSFTLVKVTPCSWKERDIGAVSFSVFTQDLQGEHDRTQPVVSLPNKKHTQAYHF